VGLKDGATALIIRNIQNNEAKQKQNDHSLNFIHGKSKSILEQAVEAYRIVRN
jgi:hypothetical protein